MRELKFRQWIEKSKQFHYWGFFEDRFESPATGSSVTFADAHRCSHQFTGLHDKTGKEIYEGDVVDLQGGYLIGDIFSGQSRDFQGVVEFIEGRFVVNCKEDEVIFELQKEYHVAVVIGNIHEEGAE